MGYKNPKLVAQHCFVSSFWSMFLVSWVEKMQYADWFICLVGIQDGSITTTLLRDKLRV